MIASGETDLLQHRRADAVWHVDVMRGGVPFDASREATRLAKANARLPQRRSQLGSELRSRGR